MEDDRNELLEKIKLQLEEDKKQRRKMIYNTNALINIYSTGVLISITILLAICGKLITSQTINLPSTIILFIGMGLITVANAGIILFSVKISLDNKTFKQFFITFVVIMLNIITNPIVLYYFYNQK